MGYRFWTAEDDEIIFAGWEAGKSVTQIACDYPAHSPRTPDTVRMRVQTLRKRGIVLKKRVGGEHIFRANSAHWKAVAAADRQERERLKKEERDARIAEIAEAEAARISAKTATARKLDGCFNVKDLLIFTDNVSPEEEKDFGRVSFVGTHIDGCTSASWGVK